MNEKLRGGGGFYDYLSRDERRKKGQRSGFKVSAVLPKKQKA